MGRKIISLFYHEKNEYAEVCIKILFNIQQLFYGENNANFFTKILGKRDDEKNFIFPSHMEKNAGDD